ncbi:MAG: hypothetical protein IPF66_16410 [Holophagales bacterium]|nr:hypothetical protein [Holophagales bacterium]
MSEKSWGSRGSGMTDGGQGTPGEGAPGPADPGNQGRQSGTGGGRGGH